MNYENWNKATVELCQKLAQQNIDLLGDNVARFSDQLKRLGNIKKPEDLMNVQKECLHENMAAWVEGMQKWMNASLENMEAFTKLCNNLRENPPVNKPSERFTK